jgi:beta-lactamase regulating signal transducer with metallopeptidase domain
MTNFYAQLQASPVLMSLFAATLKSSVVLFAAWTVNTMLHGRSAALRHMVWIAASACALTIVAFSGALPQWKVLPVAKAVAPAPAFTTIVSDSYKATITPVGSTARSVAETEQPRAKAHAARAVGPKTASAEELLAQFKVSLEPAAATPAVAASKGSRVPDWKLLLTVLWMIGIACCAGVYAASEWRLRRLTRRSVAVNDPAWQSASLAAADALGIRRQTTLLCSAEIEVPLTFGIMGPVILLPVDYTEWSAQRRHAVLRHEMAHIARWDALTQIISQIACAVYWFNPLAWVAAKSARFERELACDDLVLAAGAAPSEYAGELLTMVSKLQTREQYAVALAMARRSQFEGRLLALLNPKQKRDGASRRAALVVAVAGLAIALPLAAMAPQEAPSPANQTGAVAKGVEGGIPGGIKGGVAGGESGGTAGGVNSAAIAQQADSPSPAMAPAAVQPATPAPAGWAPRAETGTWTGATPAVDPKYGVSGPNPVNPAAQPVIAEAPRVAESWGVATPAAPVASTRTQKPAATPPPDRRTGLECTATTSAHHSSSISENDDGHTKSMIVSWNGDDCDVSLNSRGDVKFNDDFSGIQSVPQDGFLEINARIHGESHRLSVHPTNNNGPLEYVWWVNGSKQPFDDAARKWVANFMIEMDRHTAWAVKQRFPVLLRQGGAQRVLEEVSYMSSDYARSTYLMTLVQEVNLQPKELIETVNAAAGMASDYETARVLMAVAAKYPLNDQTSRQAFLSALDVINSDYEHARVLMAFFDKGPIPMAMGRAVLESASKLRSDYEHSRVLQEMAKRGLVDSSTQADFLASVNNIHSDYEHSQSLLAFLAARKSDDAAVLGVIRAAADIHSDYESARVLTTAASGRTLTGQMRDEYLKSAQHIQSQYERSRTLEAVGYHATSL